MPFQLGQLTQLINLMLNRRAIVADQNISLLCTVEEQKNLQWILNEAKKWIPHSSKLIWDEAESDIDIYCTPKLTVEQRLNFEQEFEQYDFTDIAFLSK